jgi:hypothetical protein
LKYILFSKKKLDEQDAKGLQLIAAEPLFGFFSHRTTIFFSHNKSVSAT